MKQAKQLFFHIRIRHTEVQVHNQDFLLCGQLQAYMGVLWVGNHNTPPEVKGRGDRCAPRVQGVIWMRDYTLGADIKAI